jgi:hypothetical protein
MSCKQVDVSGAITVGQDVSDCGDGRSLKQQSLKLGCSSSSFDAVVSSDIPIQITTAGQLGDAFVDLPPTDALSSVELLYVSASAIVRLLLGADVASILGVAGTFPTGFAGGEQLDLLLDGVSLTVTFTSGAQAAQQCANQINAAAALAGLTYQPAMVSGGQLLISGAKPGPLGSVEIVGGSGATTLGFTADDTADGLGEIQDVKGIFLVEYGRGNAGAPARVMISGNARVQVLAAGVPR